jgi:hypothetical protein
MIVATARVVNRCPRAAAGDERSQDIYVLVGLIGFLRPRVGEDVAAGIDDFGVYRLLSLRQREEGHPGVGQMELPCQEPPRRSPIVLNRGDDHGYRWMVRLSGRNLHNGRLALLHGVEDPGVACQSPVERLRRRRYRPEDLTLGIQTDYLVEGSQDGILPFHLLSFGIIWVKKRYEGGRLQLANGVLDQGVH